MNLAGEDSMTHNETNNLYLVSKGRLFSILPQINHKYLNELCRIH